MPRILRAWGPVLGLRHPRPADAGRHRHLLVRAPPLRHRAVGAARPARLHGGGLDARCWPAAGPGRACWWRGRGWCWRSRRCCWSRGRGWSSPSAWRSARCSSSAASAPALQLDARARPPPGRGRGGGARGAAHPGDLRAGDALLVALRPEGLDLGAAGQPDGDAGARLLAGLAGEGAGADAGAQPAAGDAAHPLQQPGALPGAAPGRRGGHRRCGAWGWASPSRAWPGSSPAAIQLWIDGGQPVSITWQVRALRCCSPSARCWSRPPAWSSPTARRRRP